MIISVVQQKGGVGKTTLSIHIADGLAKRGYKVALIDADEQRSASMWSAKREDGEVFPVMSMAKASLHRELVPLASSFDYLVIDGPPRQHDVLRSAIAASDLVLMPVKASSFDVWAVRDVVKLVEEVTPLKPTLKAAFIINELRPNTRLGRDIRDALTSHNLPVFQSAVHLRAAFPVALGQGLTVFDTEPKGKAAEDMNAVLTEIIQSVNH
jgi:chromosome partitioning protein